MSSPKSLALWSALTLCGLALAAIAAPPAAATGPDQRATRTPRPGVAATATALKPTVAAAATKAPTAVSAAKATAAALATRAAATATALKLTRTPVATVSAEQAAAAIQAYAASVLEINVAVTKAGGLTGAVNSALTQTTTGSSAQSLTVKGAAQTYGALLSNGAASLSYGSGTVTGDVTVDVQASSLGVYSLVVTPTQTLTADSALALAKKVFPGVAEMTYQVYAVNKGYAWYAQGTSTGIDLKTKKAVTLAQVVILYVLPGAGGKASVSATVGRGEFATNLKVP